MLMMLFCHDAYAASAKAVPPVTYEQAETAAVPGEKQETESVPEEAPVVPEEEQKTESAPEETAAVPEEEQKTESASEEAAAVLREEQKAVEPGETQEPENVKAEEGPAQEPPEAETTGEPQPVGEAKKGETEEPQGTRDIPDPSEDQEPQKQETDPEPPARETDPCAEGHDYACTLVTAPTLQQEGLLHAECTVCGTAEDVILPALNEEDYTYAVTAAPTCTEGGIGTYTWKITEYGDCAFEAEIPAEGHHYEDTVIDPTCTEQGYTSHVCSVCGDSYQDSFVDPLGHEFGEWILGEEGACPDDGYEYRICSRCGEQETRPVLAPDHVESDWIVDLEPTCTEPGSRHTECVNCGEILHVEDIEPLGHDFTSKVTKPTCTKKGYTTHTCRRCGYVVKDTYVAALGHKWGDWVVIEEPTYTETGLKRRTCKNDPSHIEEKTIAKLAKPRVGHAIKDENGKLRGGKAGDQTGQEVVTRSWYLHYKGWIVIRAKSAEAREMIARNMEYACANDNIGYNNADCYGLYRKAKKVGYDCSLVDEACNTDCSRLVRICLLYAGIYVPRFYTGTQLKILKGSGHFTIYTSADYTEGMDYLLRGDILLTKTTGHTVVVLNRGVYGKDTVKVPSSAPVITKQPVDRDLVEGDLARFYVDAEGKGLIYRWYYRPDKSTQWTLVTSSLGQDPHYRFYASPRHDGYQYRCDVIDVAGQHVYSDIVTLRVKTKLEILTQPEDVTVIGKGTKATVTLEAKGDGMTYAWYVCDPGDEDFTKSAVTAPEYSIGVTAARKGRRVYCVITDMYGNTVRSKTVTLDYVLIKPKITEQPESRTVKTGTKVTFRTAADGARSYQWSYRTSPKGTWIKIKDADGTAAEYTFTASGKQNGWQYRCSITNASGTVHTDTAKLTVVASKPSITSNPTGKTASAKKKVTFKVTAKGTALRYQWYFRTSSRAKWKKVTLSGHDRAALSVTAAKKRNGYQYRCVVSNLMGSVTSRAARLKVK